jgi:hypothetical protein
MPWCPCSVPARERHCPRRLWGTGQRRRAVLQQSGDAMFVQAPAITTLDHGATIVILMCAKIVLRAGRCEQWSSRFHVNDVESSSIRAPRTSTSALWVRAVTYYSKRGIHIISCGVQLHAISILAILVFIPEMKLTLLITHSDAWPWLLVCKCSNPFLIPMRRISFLRYVKDINTFSLCFCVQHVSPPRQRK